MVTDRSADPAAIAGEARTPIPTTARSRLSAVAAYERRRPACRPDALGWNWLDIVKVTSGWWDVEHPPETVMALQGPSLQIVVAGRQAPSQFASGLGRDGPNPPSALPQRLRGGLPELCPIVGGEAAHVRE